MKILVDMNLSPKWVDFLNQQPRPKGTGYVVLIKYLYSGFNTFINRPKGRGIKPLNTNKNNIEAIHWSSNGLPDTPDSEIFNYAKENDLTIFLRH